MKIAIWSIGRYQPPTKGHQKMIDFIVKLAKQHKANMYLFVTKTVNKKNPLSIKQKMRYLKDAFKGIPFVEVSNAVESIEYLKYRGIDKVIIVCGSDRKDNYLKLFKSMKDQDKIDFEFEVQAISRDPESDDVDGYSATLAREYAKNDDLEKFKTIVPNTLNKRLVEKLFQDVKEGLNG